MSIAPMLPTEREDPLDRVLDMIEANIETAIDLGLEPQIRARLARLLVAPGDSAGAEPAAGRVTGTASQPGSATGASGRLPAGQSEAPTSLDLAAILTVCRDLETYKLRAAQHAAIARLKAWLVAELTGLNAATGRLAAGESVAATKEPAACRGRDRP